MKRTLDEIELNEIESFCIDCNTLIVRTKTEENSYQYQNELELLRRISYLMHRYNVEYYRRTEKEKHQVTSNLTQVQKTCQKKLKRNSNIFLAIYMVYITLSMMFPNAISLLLNLFYVGSGIVLISTFQINATLKKEHLRKNKEKKDYEEQLDNGFASLKSVASSYLNKISKANTATNSIEIQHFIEQIEKGFQKRIGTYPQ